MHEARRPVTPAFHPGDSIPMNVKLVLVTLVAAIGLVALNCGPATPEPVTPDAVPTAAPSAGDAPDAGPAAEQPK
jgi:hypothetical protein